MILLSSPLAPAKPINEMLSLCHLTRKFYSSFTSQVKFSLQWEAGLLQASLNTPSFGISLHLGWSSDTELNLFLK